ncbi:hypothetical protein BN1708_020177, partial [Verticillium longisporum]
RRDCAHHDQGQGRRRHRADGHADARRRHPPRHDGRVPRQGPRRLPPVGRDVDRRQLEPGHRRRRRPRPHEALDGRRPRPAHPRQVRRLDRRRPRAPHHG